MFDNENTQYLVVVNGEEQYSIWPAGRDLPDGWTSVGDPAFARNVSITSKAYGPTCGRRVCARLSKIPDLSLDREIEWYSRSWLTPTI